MVKDTSEMKKIMSQTGSMKKITPDNLADIQSDTGNTSDLKKLMSQTGSMKKVTPTDVEGMTVDYDVVELESGETDSPPLRETGSQPRIQAPTKRVGGVMSNIISSIKSQNEKLDTQE